MGVDSSTLWRWAKSGYLVPVEYGGQRRYRVADVQRILNGGRHAR
ncbi:helix-turn-helix domain-containing protein [Alistipes shahii]